MTSDNCMLAGVLCFFATTCMNRFLGERNFKRLSPEDRVRLMDAFSRQRSLATYLPIGIMIAVMAICHFLPSVRTPLFIGAIVAILAISVALQVSIVRRMRTLDLPNDYVGRFWNNALLAQVGNVAALSFFAYGILLSGM